MDYIVAARKVKGGIVGSPFLSYTGAHMVEGDGMVLAKVREPYFLFSDIY